MGYTTEFRGAFELDKPLKPEHAEYLHKFADVRHMKRNAEKAASFDDPVREAVGLPIGDQGAYFVGGFGFKGQDRDDSIETHSDGNWPPESQPGLWCQWIPTEDNTGIEWDGGEKFYEYIDWIKYIIKHFLDPWGYKLNGEVEWRGEDWDDTGSILIKNNIVK
jgi:hypothetical protein